MGVWFQSVSGDPEVNRFRGVKVLRAIVGAMPPDKVDVPSVVLLAMAELGAGARAGLE